MIRDYITKLGNSRPIFSLRLNDRKSGVYSKLVERYFPVSLESSDPIEQLVVTSYSETLRGNEFTKDIDQMEKSVLSLIRQEFKRFVTNYGGYKKAKQSSVFRFLNTYSVPHGAVDGFVYLYRYAKSHGMANGAMPFGTDQKHIDNILAILELMRSNFEPKQ